MGRIAGSPVCCLSSCCQILRSTCHNRADLAIAKQQLKQAREVWWWSRPGGLMQILPATGAVEHSMQLQQYRITTPPWAAHTIMWRPNEPRTEEVNGSEHAHPFVSVLGAA